MKKKIVSMALMVVLCFVLAMSAFAEGVQYKIGDLCGLFRPYGLRILFYILG